MTQPRSRTCKECGERFLGGWLAEFCSSKCKNRFNNRRAQRGAVLYDLFMATRYQRDEAKDAGCWTFMCALAADWREEDRKERDGRKSWRPFRHVFERFPYLRR